MMRHTRKFMIIALILALSLACAFPGFAQMAPATGANQTPMNQQQPAPMAPATGTPGVGYKTAPGGTIRGGSLMPVDVYTPIRRGYTFVREGNYEAARHEFAIAAHLDELNPFALNDLGVLDERDGKLNDALAHFKDATIHAAQYRDKVQQTCFVGGSCMAVEPERKLTANSEILPIIQENIAKLEAKIAATHTPPPGVNPPPMK
jgi:tetratricopeptide (TPR) repeat protein